MKKLIALLFITFAFENCDKVPPRIPPPIPDCVLDSSVLVINTNTLTSGLRKVLIEDYTGQACGNCPPAAVILEGLLSKSKNKGKLIAIANHITVVFAAPQIKNGYLPDFRNEASTAWDASIPSGGMDISNQGLPGGMVNRVKTDESYYVKYPNWEVHVDAELAKPQSVKLDVTTAYDPAQKLLNIKVFTTFLAFYSSDVNLIMVLTQDSIIGSQKDYAPPAGVEVIDHDRRPDYRFDHIMVKSLNGTWGQLLKSSPIAQKDTVTIVKDCNLASKCFYKDAVCTDDDHQYLVVFAFNASTKEVLQVEKIKIKK